MVKLSSLLIGWFQLHITLSNVNRPKHIPVLNFITQLILVKRMVLELFPLKFSGKEWEYVYCTTKSMKASVVQKYYFSKT